MQEKGTAQDSEETRDARDTALTELRRNCT